MTFRAGLCDRRRNSVELTGYLRGCDVSFALNAYGVPLRQIRRRRDRRIRWWNYAGVMDAPLSHSSAARFWLAYGSPGVPRVIGAFGSGDTLLRAPSSHSHDRAIALGFLGYPIHYLVSSQALRHRRKGAIFHSCGAELPPGAILQIEGGLSVCSPKLAFVQMGTRLDLPLLALFGMQLCGIHAIDPCFDEGSLDRKADEGCLSGLPKRDQLTGRERLQAFTKDNSRLDGSKRAASAVSLVSDRSRSPMESATALLLGAPLRRGGYALGMPELNRKVALPQWLHEPFGRETMRGSDPYLECDFLFEHKGKRVFVDYHGEWSHSGERNVHHDALRLNALSSLECKHFTITKWQFYDSGLLDKVASQIGSALRRRPQIKMSDYQERKRLLHRKVARAVQCGYLESLCV